VTVDIYDRAQPDGKPKSIIHREPSRGGQICGYQFPGTYSYCGENKVRGLFHCRAHHDWVGLDETAVRMRTAPGIADGFTPHTVAASCCWNPMMATAPRIAECQRCACRIVATAGPLPDHAIERCKRHGGER
jgi:hypothetical protein